MKIVHVCTSDSGGASIAAQRLHDALLKIGIDSSMLFLRISRKDDGNKKFQFVKRQGRHSAISKVLTGLGIRRSQHKKNLNSLKNISGVYEIFSFPRTDYRVEDDPLVRNADIINLHWVANFINYQTFFKSVRKPIVWTFHDMNPLFGGFHYNGDRERNSISMGKLEDEIVRLKLDALSKATSISVVTPSKWLRSNLRLSDYFAKVNSFHIPYSLDLETFRPFDADLARAVFNLPMGKRVILFVSENLNNYRKGFDLFLESLRQFSLPEDVCLVAVGSITTDVGEGVISVGRITDDRLMALLYSAADLFVMPSREDNFPNVVIESIACGTPVLAYAVGGIPEVVIHGFNGILVDQVSAQSLGNAMNSFFNRQYSFDRYALRQFAIEHFELKIQAKRYEELYRKLLG